MRPQTGFVFLLSTFLAGIGGAALGGGAVNESPISFDTKESVFIGQIQLCWKGAGGAVPLREVGISNWDLIRGLSCVVGDFDGNGYLDFGFRGRALEGVEARPTLRVVFYERDQVLRTIDLLDSSLVLYPATDVEGPFGEPASKWDGLVSWGEGGSTFVYLYDPESGTFKVSEHASENA